MEATEVLITTPPAIINISDCSGPRPARTTPPTTKTLEPGRIEIVARDEQSNPTFATLAVRFKSFCILHAGRGYAY